MPFSFPTLLRRHLRARGITIRTFATMVGASVGNVGDVLRENRLPPEDLGRWASALGLEGRDREQFVLQGGLARSPASVIAHVRQQAARIAELERDLAAKR